MASGCVGMGQEAPGSPTTQDRRAQRTQRKRDNQRRELQGNLIIRHVRSFLNHKEAPCPKQAHFSCSLFYLII